MFVKKHKTAEREKAELIRELWVVRKQRSDWLLSHLQDHLKKNENIWTNSCLPSLNASSRFTAGIKVSLNSCRNQTFADRNPARCSSSHWIRSESEPWPGWPGWSGWSVFQPVKQDEFLSLRGAPGCRQAECLWGEVFAQEDVKLRSKCWSRTLPESPDWIIIRSLSSSAAEQPLWPSVLFKEHD